MAAGTIVAFGDAAVGYNPMMLSRAVAGYSEQKATFKN